MSVTLMTGDPFRARNAELKISRFIYVERKCHHSLRGNSILDAVFFLGLAESWTASPLSQVTGCGYVNLFYRMIRCFFQMTLSGRDHCTTRSEIASKIK